MGMEFVFVHFIRQNYPGSSHASRASTVAEPTKMLSSRSCVLVADVHEDAFGGDFGRFMECWISTNEVYNRLMGGGQHRSILAGSYVWIEKKHQDILRLACTHF